MERYFLRSNGRLGNTELFKVYKWGEVQDYFCFSGNILECEAWIRLKESGHMEE